LNSASFMLAVSSLQMLASMVTAMRRAGFPAASSPVV
jgi:hypothetical protein